MKRAKGILLRWQKEKENDSVVSRVAPLTDIIDLQYGKYKSICYWCNEKPKAKGEWLRQEIELSDN